MTLPCPEGPDPREDLLDEFLAQWRHALRGPLNALLAAAQVLEAAPAGSEEAAQARDIIRRQARQLAWLVSDIPPRVPGRIPSRMSSDLPRGDAPAPGA